MEASAGLMSWFARRLSFRNLWVTRQVASRPPKYRVSKALFELLNTNMVAVGGAHWRRLQYRLQPSDRGGQKPRGTVMCDVQWV
jgi:hypothetical protein